MRDMTTTGKVERHGKTRRRSGPIILKGTSGVVNQGLSRMHGTRDNIHSKNGHPRRLLLRMHLLPPPPGLLPSRPGVTILKGRTALLDNLLWPSTHHLQDRLLGCPHPAVNMTLL